MGSDDLDLEKGPSKEEQEMNVIDLKENKQEGSNEKDGKKKKEKKEKLPKVSVGKMFTYSTRWDRFLIILGVIGSMGQGAMLPLFSLVFGDLIDAFNLPPSEVEKKFLELALKFLYLGAGAAVSSFFQHTMFNLTSHRQAARLREAFLAAILKQEVAYYDQTSAGSLVSHMSSDTVLFQEALGDKLGLAIQSMSTFIGGFIMGFTKGWQLTLVICAASPLVAASGAFMMILMSTFTLKGQESYAKAGAIASEAFAGVRTIASFNAEKIPLSRYSVNLHEATELGIKRAFVAGGGIGMTFFIFYSVYALGLWYGGQLIVKHGFTGGSILTVFFSVLIGAFALGQATSNLEAFSKGQGAAYKLFQVIERQPAIDSSSEEGEKPSKVKGTIVFKGISFRYPTRPEAQIFNKMDLKIPRGKTVALVGPSGSGKSSIVGLIQRFYDPEEGTVTLDKRDLKTLNLKWLRSQIGLVGQEPVLFAGTIAENIRYAREDATMEEIIEAAKSANAHNFISQFPDGYNTYVGEKGAQLSGGQKQRIAIARAIIKNPKILLLDEATSALDNESEKIVQEALDKLMTGRTTIVVAHRLSTIRNADIIAVISKGAVTELGKHDELMEKNGIYAELVRLQGGANPTEERAKLERKQSERKKATEAADKVSEITKKEKDEDPDKIHKVPTSRLIKMNEPEYPWLGIGLFAALINGLVNPVFSLLFTELIGAYFKPLNEIEDAVLPWIISFIAIGAGVLIFQTLQAGMFGLAGEKLVRRVRERSFLAIIRKNIGWFDDEKHNSGLLAARLASDATLISGLVGPRLGTVMMNIATIVAGLTIAFYYQWQLTLVILATTPMMVFANFMRMMALKKMGNRTEEATDEANQVAAEAIQNIRTVASFTGEDKIQWKFQQKLKGPTDELLRKESITGVLTAVGDGLMFVSYFINFWYGGKMIADGDVNFMDMMRVFMAIMMSAMGVSQSMAFAPDVPKAKLAAAHIFKLIDEKSPIDPFDQSGQEIKDLEGEIELQNVSFRYPTRPDIPILDGINLKIEPGKVTALVGASGCGKSSTVALIERFYDVNEGKITLDGVDLRDINLRFLRRQVGLVGQEPVLFAGTIAENIRYGDPDASDEQVIEAAKAANAHNFISEFPDGYNTNVGEKGTQLSGGQKQRIAIARAIIKNPKILLLDEATSALDTESERIVQEALDRVMQGRTTLIIAHRLSTVRHAHSIVVMSKGKVEEIGNHDELMQKGGVYYKLVNRQ